MANSGFKLEAILLAKPIAQIDAQKVNRALRDFGAGALSDFKDYPPSRSTYRRTGTLGRRWTMSGPRKSGDDIVVQVGNTTEYTGRVQGFKSGANVSPEYKQTRVAQRAGWPSLEDVLDRHWAAARKDILAALA